MAKQKKRTKTVKQKAVSTDSVSSQKWYILAIVLVVGAVFSPVFNYDFVNFDDGILVVDNPLVIDNTVSYLECFKNNIFNVHYKPLTFLTWKAEYQLLGNNPTHFHAINWLFHILNALLLFLIGTKLFRNIYKKENQALFSALGLSLLFALNPLRIESVAWVSERKDVMFAFFFLASWLSYLYYVKSKKMIFIVVGALLYLCSGLSKSMGLPLIAILFVTDYFFHRQWSIKLLVEKLPYFIVFLILIFLYGLLGNSATPLANAALAEALPFQTNVQGYLEQIPAFVQWPISASTRFYLWLVHSLIPIKLSIAYPGDQIYQFFGVLLYAFPALLLGLFSWLITKRNQHRNIFIGIGFFAITLSPALALNTTGYGIFLADRYTYIPSIGIFFVLMLLLNKLKTNYRNIFFIIICLFYIIATALQLGHWKNSETLFKQVIQVDPKTNIGHLNLGNYLLANQKYSEAIKSFNEGSFHHPNDPNIYFNRARVYLEQGEFDRGLLDLNKCLSIAPDYTKAIVNRGIVYAQKGHFDRALSEFDRAISLNPKDKSAYLNRGIIHFQRKEYAKALKDHQQHVELNPKDYDSKNTIGICFNALGQVDEAIRQFNEIIDKNPSNGTFYFNRSMAYQNKGNRTLALEDARKAHQLGYPVDPVYLSPLKPLSGNTLKVN